VITSAYRGNIAALNNHPFKLKMTARQSFRRVVPSGEDKSFQVILAPLNFTSKAKPNMA